MPTPNQHDEVIAKLMKRPGVRKEVERIELKESQLRDALLEGHHNVGLTQLAEHISEKF
jgi:hypothetical protein